MKYPLNLREGQKILIHLNNEISKRGVIERIDEYGLIFLRSNQDIAGAIVEKFYVINPYNWNYILIEEDVDED